MTLQLPKPTRKDDVLEKLAYAENEYQELSKALTDSYESGELPKFVSMKAEGILSNTRECFDYLAHDLIEGYLVPVASKKFVDSYKDGKEKTYYPFYSGQLAKPQWPWHQFKTVKKDVFDHLQGFIEAMDKQQHVASTKFAARDFRVVQEMVNEKKHSKVTQYDVVADAVVFHKGPSGMVILDKATASIPGLEVGSEFGGDKPKSAPGFRFAANGRDVPRLCLFAVHATKMIMDWWYETHFQPTGQRINNLGPIMDNGIPVDRPVWAYEKR